MKTYFKDLADLQKESNEFMKKHLFGHIVFSVGVGTIIGFGVPFAIKKIHKIKTEKEKYSSETES